MSAHEQNLPSIRARAIELSETPDLFDQPLCDFETPGEYKREADAHLALCIDAIATKITASSDKTIADFTEDFGQCAAELFPGMQNDEINPFEIALNFSQRFGMFFREHGAIEYTLKDTGIGIRTGEVCKKYDAAAREHIKDDPQPTESAVNHWLYLNPRGLINNGLGELESVFAKTVMAIPQHGGSVPEREAYVRTLPRIIQQLSSLSINQIVTDREPTFGVSVERSLFTLDSVSRMRQCPVYRDASHAVLRPHGMCPALPKLPENDRLSGGSGLLKLAQLGSELVVATNLHALGINDPDYPIVGRSYSKPV